MNPNDCGSQALLDGHYLRPSYSRSRRTECWERVDKPSLRVFHCISFLHHSHDYGVARVPQADESKTPRVAVHYSRTSLG
jgi:hypothetical protein